MPQMLGMSHSALALHASPGWRGELQRPPWQLLLVHWLSAVHEAPFAIFATQEPFGPG
jgi:hypothetical protein